MYLETTLSVLYLSLYKVVFTFEKKLKTHVRLEWIAGTIKGKY